MNADSSSENVSNQFINPRTKIQLPSELIIQHYFNKNIVKASFDTRKHIRPYVDTKEFYFLASLKS